MRRSRIALALILLVLVLLQLYVNNRFSLMTLAVGIFLPALSVLLCVLMHRRVSAELTAPVELERGSGGDQPVILRFRNRSWISAADVSAEVSMTNVLTGTSLTQNIHRTVSGRSVRLVGIAVDQVELGEIDIAVSQLKVSDLFRLVSFPVGPALKDSFVVVPPVFPTNVVALEARETSGDSEKYSENEPGRDVSELYDLRDYAPGDEVRAIHWKQSAKLDRLVVREFGKPLNYSAVLLVELAGDKSDALEACAGYAVNLSRGLLEAGILHTLAWYDKRTDQYCSCNLTTFDELEQATLQLLSSAPHQHPDSALLRFLESDAADPETVLIYITPTVESPALPQAAVAMPTRILWVGGDPASAGDAEDLPLEMLPETLDQVQTLDLTL